MAIKKHDSSKRKHAVSAIESNLDKCLNIQNVPESIRAQIIALQEEINSLDLESLDTPVELTGRVATQEEVLFMIKDISDYSKWESMNNSGNTKENEEHLEWIKKEYNVTFNNIDIKHYFIRCDIYGKDIVSVVDVTALPGYFFVSYQTSSVGWSEKNLLNLKEFKSAISANVE